MCRGSSLRRNRRSGAVHVKPPEQPSPEAPVPPAPRPPHSTHNNNNTTTTAATMQAAQQQYDFFSDDNAAKWRGLLVPALDKVTPERGPLVAYFPFRGPGPSRRVRRHGSLVTSQQQQHRPEGHRGVPWWYGAPDSQSLIWSPKSIPADLEREAGVRPGSVAGHRQSGHRLLDFHPSVALLSTATPRSGLNQHSVCGLSLKSDDCGGTVQSGRQSPPYQTSIP